MSPARHDQDAAHRPAAAPDASLVEVLVDALAPGGDAVGRQCDGASAGRATFVALAAPGERVLARLTRQKARVAWADLVAVREPSVHRVAPPCPLFGRCGGCQWQHVRLDAQRDAKRAIVARALGLSRVDLIAPSAAGSGYRDRARLVVGEGGTFGFRARRSHQIVDVPHCLLLTPPLQRALTALRARPVGLQRAGTEVDLQAGRAGVHLTIHAPGPRRADTGRGAGAGHSDKDSLTAVPSTWAEAGVVGVCLVHATARRDLGLRDVDIGAVDQGALRVPAGAFAQVGRAANDALVAAVLDQVGADPGRVLELYAGSGNFTRGLCARATQVVACEVDPEAVLRGQRNAPAASWLARPPPRIDAAVAVVDPPRAGIDGENLAAAVQARRRVVYVSCDPQTLGRDVERLRQAGFHLVRAVALDLMPHTHHVEVVATLERVEAR